MNVKIPAEDGDKIVFTIASLAASPLPPIIPAEEAPLNMSHPNQRIRVPKTTSFGL